MGGLPRRHAAQSAPVQPKDLTSRYVPNTLPPMESVECGRGTIAWPALLSGASAAGVCHAYIEQEPPYGRPTVAPVQRSLEYLRTVR